MASLKQMSLQTRLETTVIYAILTMVALVCILPLFHVFALSFSSNEAVLGRQVSLWPIGFNLGNYSIVFKDPGTFQALVFSIALTLCFTAVAMVLSIAMAYPLTRPEMRGRKFFSTVLIITMYFSGGILPLYILIKSLGMLNTMWSLILPLAISPFNVIILRTSLSSLPDSVTEAALIDGASYFQILTRIVLPLSTPILATLSLFYAVGRWNTFQDALFYITNSAMYTLQLKLTTMIMNTTSPEILMNEGASAIQVVPAAITAATVIVATVPILLAYPKLQRYFISGVMIGSVKE